MSCDIISREPKLLFLVGDYFPVSDNAQAYTPRSFVLPSDTFRLFLCFLEVKFCVGVDFYDNVLVVFKYFQINCKT